MMTPENFCYWLQGFFELTDTESLEPDQIDMIKEHLALVFNKVTKSRVEPLSTSYPLYPWITDKTYCDKPTCSCPAEHFQPDYQRMDTCLTC